MEIEILEEKENPLLGRKEVKFTIKYHGSTPTRQEVRNKLIAMLDSNKELTVLQYVKSSFGSTTAEGYVKVYTDEESMKVEHQHMLDRNFKEPEKPEGEEAPAPEAEAPAEEAPKAEAPEEKPAEVESEEKPAEAESEPKAEVPDKGAEEKPEEKEGE